MGKKAGAAENNKEKTMRQKTWIKKLDKVSIPILVGVIMAILAWMVTAQAENIQWLLILLVGAISTGIVFLHRVIKPYLGTWTAWVGLTLLGFVVLAVIAKLTPQCYSISTGEPIMCSNKEVLGLSGSILFMPIILAILYLPVKYGTKTAKRLSKKVKTLMKDDVEKVKPENKTINKNRKQKDKQKKKTETVNKNKALTESKTARFWRKNKKQEQ